MVLAASMIIYSFIMNLLAVSDSRIVRSREPFDNTKDFTAREALVPIFNIEVLLILFLKLA